MRGLMTPPSVCLDLSSIGRWRRASAQCTRPGPAGRVPGHRRGPVEKPRPARARPKQQWSAPWLRRKTLSLASSAALFQQPRLEQRPVGELRRRATWSRCERCWETSEHRRRMALAGAKRRSQRPTVRIASASPSPAADGTCRSEAARGPRTLQRHLQSGDSRVSASRLTERRLPCPATAHFRRAASLAGQQRRPALRCSFLQQAEGDLGAGFRINGHDAHRPDDVAALDRRLAFGLAAGRRRGARGGGGDGGRGAGARSRQRGGHPAAQPDPGPLLRPPRRGRRRAARGLGRLTAPVPRRPMPGAPERLDP